VPRFITSNLSILFLCLLWLTPAAALEGGGNYFGSTAELSGWIQNYYRNPDPGHLPDAVEVLVNDPRAMSQVWRLDSQIDFLAAASDGSIPGVDERLKSGDLSASQRLFLEKLAYANENYSALKPRDPNDIDRLWGRFFATGDTSHLAAILGVLDYSEDEIDLDSKFWRFQDIKDTAVALEMVQKSAIWSLSANAKKHPRVKEFLQNALVSGKVSPSARQTVQMILDNT
jgi:hypothetical protein